MLTLSLLAGWAFETPSRPTLEQKIDQMLMVGFRGTAVDGNHLIIRDIQDYGLGGVILFNYDVIQKQGKRNIFSPAQLKTLVSNLQEPAAPTAKCFRMAFHEFFIFGGKNLFFQLTK